MKIDLNFEGEEIVAKATIVFDQKKYNEYRFWLNNNLNVVEIKCNQKIIDWEKIKEIKPSFRSLSQEICVVNGTYINELTIEYRGIITGWHNTITEEIKSLNWYSVWFPQEISDEEPYGEVDIHGCEHYLLIKGEYDSEKEVWKYGDTKYDPFNIVLYKKELLKIVSNPYVNIYYVDTKIEGNTKRVEELYKEILDYYNDHLFTKKITNKLEVACLFPASKDEGAYKRPELMVCSALRENDLGNARLLSHELAHEWCNGADCDTWEDWLNEATADWASLLYALDTNNEELFYFILKPKLEVYEGLPVIKTVDGSRPNGVHDKGTILFYKVYKEYGIDTVRQIIRIFSELSIITTENLLNQIKRLISTEVADFIEEGINSKII